ncbi:PilX N-terminal domain-containing pilus assembly protein [Herbaspirillum sp.]|uniref:pilus assembly PilX family protein n=1 Tax=Herbaspirillum sp. TaxID=1890675 RepID=UPI0031D27F02
MNHPPSRQRGATLMIALIMLTVILLLGVASASLLMLDERAARNHRFHEQARMAAQAALDDACEQIRNNTHIVADGLSTASLPPDVSGATLPPHYRIERIAASLYRISATGFGRDGAQVPLQSIVQRRTDADGLAQCLAIGWRTLRSPQ